MFKTSAFGTLTTEEEIREWMNRYIDTFDVNANPAVYCGTYYKYNGGSLDGMWIDITAFTSYEEFYDFCRLLHRDEHDPEFMFQDFQNFPECWYSESFGEETFDNIIEYAAGDREMYDAYSDYHGDLDLEDAQEKYQGQWDDEEDFARSIFEDCYDTRDIPDFFLNYFDFEAFARDLFLSDYDFCDGYVFSSY